MKKSTIPILLVLCLPASAQVDPPDPLPAPQIGVSVIKGAPQGLGGGGGAIVAGNNVWISSSSAGGVPPLVLRFSGGHDDANPAMEEDLNIMTRLIENALERGLGDDSPDVKMGIR